MKKLKLRKPARPPAPAPAPSGASTSSGIPIKFSVNVVIPAGIAGPIARFLQAGSESPFRDVSEVPPSLRPFIASDVDELGELDDSPRSLNYTLNTVYSVDANDRRRARGIEREVVDLQRAQEEQQYWEEALSAEPSEQVKAAMKIIQQDHELSVGRRSSGGSIPATRARDGRRTRAAIQRRGPERRRRIALSVRPSMRKTKQWHVSN